MLETNRTLKHAQNSFTIMQTKIMIHHLDMDIEQCEHN